MSALVNPTHLLAFRPGPATLLLLAWVALPVGAFGQRIDHEDIETIRPSAKATPQGKRPDLDQVGKLIIQKTNEFRRQEGLPQVEVNSKLTESAHYFANYMARTNQFGHTADGNRPADRVKKSGYEYCIVSENIAYQHNSQGFTTEELAEQSVQGWKNSPGHRQNMLDPDVTETGVAVAQGEDSGYYYAVQLFRRPKSASIQFQVANQSDVPTQYQVGGQKFTLPPGFTRSHQRCRPAEVTFQWPEDKGEPTTVKPGNGDRYVIVQEKEQFRLRKE